MTANPPNSPNEDREFEIQMVEYQRDYDTTNSVLTALIAIGFSLAVAIGTISYTEIAQSIRLYLLPISLGSLAVGAVCTGYLLIYHKVLAPRSLESIRKRFINANSNTSPAPIAPKSDAAPATLEEKVDLLLRSFQGNQAERQKEKILTKLDGLYTLLISLSTFIFGIAISQRVTLGLNTILWFPLIGIVVTMILSFILGVKGMIITRESIINRMLSYCLLLSLPIWLVTVPLLMLVSTGLNSLELVVVVFLTGFLLSVITFVLSKRLIGWFMKEFPCLFVGEDDIYRKVRTKIIPYVTIILGIATIITTIIILVTFQCAVQEIINSLHTPSPMPTS